MTSGEQEHVVETFCRTRARALALQRATRDARAEQSDAKRTIGELLRASMERNRVRCVALQGDGPPMEARRALAPPRAPPLQTEDEVVALVADGTERRVRELAAADVPAFVGKLVRERFRARAAGPSKEVLRVVKAKTPRQPRAPRAASTTSAPSDVGRPVAGSDAIDATDATQPPPSAPLPEEVARLATRYATALSEKRHTDAALRPVRAATRDARAQLLDVLTNDEPVQVRVDRADGRASQLTLTRVTHVAARASRPPTYGIRTVCTVARDAAADVVAQRESDATAAAASFEAVLAACVRRRLREAARARDAAPATLSVRQRRAT